MISSRHMWDPKHFRFITSTNGIMVQLMQCVSSVSRTPGWQVCRSLQHNQSAYTSKTSQQFSQSYILNFRWRLCHTFFLRRVDVESYGSPIQSASKINVEWVMFWVIWLANALSWNNIKRKSFTAYAMYFSPWIFYLCMYCSPWKGKKNYAFYL